jgi:cytochrome c
MPSSTRLNSHLTVAAILCSALTLPLGAQASQDLATKAGCVACHKVDAKLVGPAYKEVAAKYKGRADAIPYLAKRVRQGGPGNWGQVPMMANDVSRISDADLNALLAWVLKAS